MITNPGYLALGLHFGTSQAKAFMVVFVDDRHRAIAIEELFCGTLTQASAPGGQRSNCKS